MARRSRRDGSVWLFILIAFGFSWAFWIPEALRTNGVALPTWLSSLLDNRWNVAAFGPSVAALILVARAGPAKVARFLLDRLLTPFRPWLLLPALGLMPAIAALALWAGTPEGATPQFAAGLSPSAALTGFALMFLTGGPLQEELGWRGWLLPRLQDRQAGLTAALIVGVVWSLWHLPLQFEAGLRGPQYVASIPIILGSLVTLTAVSVILTWLVNAGNENVVLAMLFHAAMNWATFVAFPVFEQEFALALYTLALVIVALAVVLVAGPGRLGRRKRRR